MIVHNLHWNFLFRILRLLKKNLYWPPPLLHISYKIILWQFHLSWGMSNTSCTGANNTSSWSLTKCLLDQFISPFLVFVGVVGGFTFLYNKDKWFTKTKHKDCWTSITFNGKLLGCLVALYIVNRKNLELKPSFKQLGENHQ